MLIHGLKHLHVKFQVNQSQFGWSEAQLDIRGALVILQSKSQNSRFTVKVDIFWWTITIWSHIHHLIKGWSWFIKICQDSKVSIFGYSDEKSTELWPALESSFFIRNFPSKACFEEDSILYKVMFHKHWLKMLYLEDTSQDITSPFEKSTKVNFFKRAHKEHGRQFWHETKSIG